MKYKIIKFKIYEVCSKSITNFVFSKVIYLFMSAYFVPFKVISTRYYTLVPTFFFQSSKHFKKSLGWLSFGFHVITINSWFVTSYDPLEQTWVVADRVKYPLSNVNVEIEQFWYEFRGDPFHAQIIGKNHTSQSICLGSQQLL